jgi:DNA repair protein SbcD/Mre11
MKLLAVGDLHLGRRPSRLPASLADRAAEFGPAAAWRRLVGHAVAQQVDAVVLAGDLVEREDDYFEAYRDLHEGVKLLTAAGIRVLGVAGNHDVLVLPRLAAHLPDFELLGRDGQWQGVELEARGEQLQLWGWSFPRKVVVESPLARQQFPAASGLRLGLLHCDRDAAGSQYAPVTTAELHAAGLDGWLLGHIHQPDALMAEHLQGYLGCVSGMDPGEPGARGPWLIEIERGRIARCQQWLLAPIVYERLDLDLSGIAHAEEAQDALLVALSPLEQQLAARLDPPEAVALRVRLTGRTAHGAEAASVLSASGPSTQSDLLPVAGSSRHYFIERIIDATEPVIALTELAGRADPLGLLAQRLLLLDAPASDPDRQALLRRSRRHLEQQVQAPHWREALGDGLDDEAVADYLRRAGRQALAEMLSQAESA